MWFYLLTCSAYKHKKSPKECGSVLRHIMENVFRLNPVQSNPNCGFFSSKYLQIFFMVALIWTHFTLCKSAPRVRAAATLSQQHLYLFTVQPNKLTSEVRSEKAAAAGVWCHCPGIVCCKTAGHGKTARITWEDVSTLHGLSPGFHLAPASFHHSPEHAVKQIWWSWLHSCFSRQRKKQRRSTLCFSSWVPLLPALAASYCTSRPGGVKRLKSEAFTNEIPSQWITLTLFPADVWAIQYNRT